MDGNKIGRTWISTGCLYLFVMFSCSFVLWCFLSSGSSSDGQSRWMGWLQGLMLKASRPQSGSRTSSRDPPLSQFDVPDRPPGMVIFGLGGDRQTSSRAQHGGRVTLGL
ncbi:hypothetical protein GQ53DRAFT_749196 [Thozetella sp. PMI_491]|nr:hypothetical protein GQ53DRAFT_749196 [Thozetella sp. PMI_491]